MSYEFGKRIVHNQSASRKHSVTSNYACEACSQTFATNRKDR